MADESTFGGDTVPGTMGGGPASAGFGSALAFGGGEPAGPGDGGGAAEVAAPAPQAPQPAPAERGGIFGSGLSFGPKYTAPDPALSALDQTADTLQQRVKRANDIAANPLLQILNPEGVQAARAFVPQAAEMLQKIKTQQAAIVAGKQQAATLGLEPGEVADEATQADRVEVAKARALRGDLRVFKGLQAVDPTAAGAIQDQVIEVAGGHLNKAQFAFDKLSNMRNQGEYSAAVASLRSDGTLGSLEALGLKVPPTFDKFNAVRAQEGMALREARIGIDGVRAKLEERNTYQPMEKKEAETYAGRLTTAFGDQIGNGTWGRNASSNARGLIVNGAADYRDLGKKYTLATPEQRKAIGEEATQAVPKAELEKARAFDRTYELANPTEEQKKRGDKINTNPNVQQAIAEQLASMLRGGTGGANVGLLNIETSKRGYVQGLLDKITAGYAGGINTITGKDVRGYMTHLTQDQIREVMDGIKAHNDELLDDRLGPIAKRAGALGLDTSALGWGKDEAKGVIGDAIEQGRREQIERLAPYHQSIGGGDGVFQIGAQRPGAGATAAPAGTGPVTQLPGASPVATPVQQALPGGPSPSPSGGGSSPAAPPVPSGSPPAGPAGGAPPVPTMPAQAVQVAGQTVNVALPPGASPRFVPALQRIESGKEKDPWTASPPKRPDGTEMSSAKGAFQFINDTWMRNKPADAPNDPSKATPAQQTQALVNLTAKNAASLTAAKLPVNDTNLYIAHNLGATGAQKLLTADVNADARTVVGEAAARNNPTFFRGKPTVFTALTRYSTEMQGLPDDAGPKPRPGAGGATAEAPAAAAKEEPSLLRRISRVLSSGVAGGDEGKDKAVAAVGEAATEHAPAIGSTLGAVGGSLAGPVGTVAGGAAGGGAGQSLKDWLQGRDQNPAEIAKQTALGGVLGVGTAARPVLSAVGRAAGAGAVEGTAAAIEGKDAADVAEAAGKGSALAAGGEVFGRALGMAGHKVWSLFAPEAKTAVREAAQKFADAEATLAKEQPKLSNATGGSVPNPKYEAAEAARTEAEQTLKNAGLKPEEAAYAHKVSSEGVPKQEAEAAKPGALEKERIGQGYQGLREEVGAAGVGAPKAAPKLPDGPRAAIEAKQVSAAHAELAERVEAAITAPAPNWQTKWTQLQEARSDLLQAERDALSSTAPGRTQTAKDMRTLADTVRKQQEKAAKYVFGEKDGAAFMDRLKTLDVRYRNLMEATNGGDLTKAAAMKGEAGRDADRKFRAFAHDDPTAIAAWNAMRRTGANLEQGVHDLVAAERIPFLGKVFSAVKLAGSFNTWMRNRASGSPITFEQALNAPADTTGRAVRDITGTAAQRGATM